MITVERIESDFSSQEVAEMSGVSQDLQRDWRRRGIIPAREGRSRIRYSLLEVCRLKVLGILSQSGVSVKLQHLMAIQVAGFAAARVRQMRAAAAIEGDLAEGDFAEEGNFDFERLVEGIDGGLLGEHYTLFRLPEPPDNSGIAHACVGGTSLPDVMDMALKDGPLAAALVLEALALAQEIVAAAPRPIVTYRFTDTGGDE